MSIKKAKKIYIKICISIILFLLYPWIIFPRDPQEIRIGMRKENIEELFNGAKLIADQLNRDLDMNKKIKLIGIEGKENIFDKLISKEIDIVITSPIDYYKYGHLLSDKIFFYKEGNSRLFMCVSCVSKEITQAKDLAEKGKIGCSGNLTIEEIAISDLTSALNIEYGKSPNIKDRYILNKLLSKTDLSGALTSRDIVTALNESYINVLLMSTKDFKLSSFHKGVTDRLRGNLVLLKVFDNNHSLASRLLTEMNKVSRMKSYYDYYFEIMIPRKINSFEIDEPILSFQKIESLCIAFLEDKKEIMKQFMSIICKEPNKYIGDTRNEDYEKIIRKVNFLSRILDEEKRKQVSRKFYKLAKASDKHAIQYFTIAFDLNPNKFWIANNLSYTLYENKDYERCIIFAKRAIELLTDTSYILNDKDKAKPFTTLGASYNALNKPAVAKKIFVEGLTVAPNNPKLKENLDITKAILEWR